jgi:hypothetical protein
MIFSETTAPARPMPPGRAGCAVTAGDHRIRYS